MKGRWLAGALVAVLALALLGQTLRWRHRLAAGRLLARAEAVTMLVQSGRAPSGMLAQNLAILRQAAALDPGEIGIPLARGSQHLLLGSFDAAAAAYREALALEPRPEIYLNLGRAELEAGRTEEARHAFATAARLDPKLADLVPAGMR